MSCSCFRGKQFDLCKYVLWYVSPGVSLTVGSLSMDITQEAEYNHSFYTLVP